MEATIAQVLHMGLVDCHIADTAGIRCGDSNGSRDACLARYVLEADGGNTHILQDLSAEGADEDPVEAGIRIHILHRPVLVDSTAPPSAIADNLDGLGLAGRSPANLAFVNLQVLASKQVDGVISTSILVHREEVNVQLGNAVHVEATTHITAGWACHRDIHIANPSTVDLVPASPIGIDANVEASDLEVLADEGLTTLGRAIKVNGLHGLVAGQGGTGLNGQVAGMVTLAKDQPVLLTGIGGALDNAQVRVCPNHAHISCPVREAVIHLVGRAGWGDDDDAATPCREAGHTHLVGILVGRGGPTATEPEPAWAHHPAVGEGHRARAVKDLLLRMGQDLAGAVDREGIGGVDKELPRPHEPQHDIVGDGRVRPNGDRTPNQQRGIGASNTGNGHGQAITELVHREDGVVELAGVLEARIDEELATHVQVITEREDQRAPILEDVVELRIEVRTQQNLIAVPCFDS